MSERMVVVGGCGRVGLPFGISFALAGLEVDLLDTNRHVSDVVMSGRMPFQEKDGQEALEMALASKRLRADRQRSEGFMKFYEIIQGAEHVVVTIGTPVDGYGNPRMGPLLDLMGDMLPFLEDGQHVMLRSTVFPGTTMRLRRLLDDAGLKGVLLTFCPERIVQGHALEELKKLPQIISGTSEKAISRAAWLFTRLGDEEVQTIACGVAEAELAKLFCNSWRYIKFAAANQFYEMTTSLGASWLGVFDAMTIGYERMRDFPTPGLAAGPCLLKDTQQLAAAFPGRFSLGEAARQVNEGMPELIAKQVDEALSKIFVRGDHGNEGRLRSATVGILGMTFKAGSDDTRDSLSFKLRKILEWRGVRVIFSDEHASISGATTLQDVLRRSDVVVIAVPHRAYIGIASQTTVSSRNTDWREQIVVNPWT